jgi:hypothetical protein
MVTNTFHHGRGTRVTDSETLSSHTAEVASTTSSTVKTGVTDDDVLFSLESSATRGIDDETTSRQTLTDIVIGVTFQLQGDTRGQISTEGLTGGSLNVGVDGVLRQTFATIATADLVRQSSTQATVGVYDVTLDSAGKTLLQSKLRFSNELVVKTSVETVVLFADIVGGHTRAKRVSRGENKREVNLLLLRGAGVVPDLEKLGTTNHLVDGADTQLGHDSTQLIGDIVEEVDDVFGGTLELLAEFRVLSGNTDRASVEVAFPMSR